MRATRLDNGNLSVPFSIMLPNGAILDGQKEITPDDPDYDKWLPFIGEDSDNQHGQSQDAV